MGFREAKFSTSPNEISSSNIRGRRDIVRAAIKDVKYVLPIVDITANKTPIKTRWIKKDRID